MNRKTKIIISVSGIFIVLLALLGLTYAYFLTRINGNTNDKSISVTTANLELTYQDGNGTITDTNIMPGYTMTKTFTVQNGGSENATYLIVLENVNNTFTRIQDLTYTLKKGSTIVKTGTITNNTEQVLAQVTTNKNITDTYTLIVNYVNLDDVDQSDDMGASLEFKVNIKNSIREGNELLADNIINNAKANKNGTKYSPTPLTTPQVSVSGENEKTLSIAEDDYGDSYYFRGSVEDNYVTFNNMCWRIVRIEGDESVKLILADKDNPCSIKTPEATYGAYVGYGFYGIDPDNSDRANYLDSILTVYGDAYNYDTVFNNFLYGGEVAMNAWNSITNSYEKKEYEAFSSSVLSKLKNDTWCLDDTTETDYYLKNSTALTKSTKRLEIDNTVSLKCDDSFSSHIATLTADEVVLAGGKLGMAGNLSNFYLISNSGIKEDQCKPNWCFDYWNTLTVATADSFQSSVDYVGVVSPHEGLSYVSLGPALGAINEPTYARPAITLKSGIKIISGEGTLTNPYIIED